MLKKLACILVVAAGCNSSEQTPAPAVPSAPAARPAPAPKPAVVRAASGPWRDRVTADLDSLRTASPALLAELDQLAPTTTRAGFVRFTSDAIHDPRAASVFLDRLVRGGDSEEVRSALVEALPRTGGAFGDALVELYGSETSAIVRSAYLFAARRAPATDALALVKRGLADGASTVQAEAARTAAAHASGKQLAAELRAALHAGDPAVRSEVARTLGILGVAGARDELVGLLTDASGDVRLESLRAIERIEPGFAATLPLDRLANDSDPRVVALVARLTKPNVQPAQTR
jgi:HEAT repeat protein